MSCEAVIEARNLSIGYRRNGRTVKCVHKNLSFSLYSGQLTCLLGPNGAGKSTLLRTLSASQKALAGEWRLNGKPANRYSERELSRWIGLALTDRTFAGGLRVSELVSLGRYPHTGFLGRLSVQDKEQVQRAMEQVGIADKAHSYVAQLSDGERQKVMIAKALAQECPVVLLDEPTAFLDVVSRIEMMNLLHDLAVKQQKTILLSTHDLEQALQLADRLWLLSRTEGLVCGNTEDMVLSNAIDRFFKKGDISFDTLTGSFRPAVSGSIKVAVEAKNAELLFWMKNALTRNDFLACEWGDPEAEYSLRVSSAQKIEIYHWTILQTVAPDVGHTLYVLNKETKPCPK